MTPVVVRKHRIPTKSSLQCMLRPTSTVTGIHVEYFGNCGSCWFVDPFPCHKALYRYDNTNHTSKSVI